MNNENNFLEKFLQRWLPPFVSSSPTYKTSPPGLHNQDSSLDICAKFQSFTVCYSIDCHVVLHLCYHRDAGTIIWNIFLRDFRPKYIITICHDPTYPRCLATWNTTLILNTTVIIILKHSWRVFWFCFGESSQPVT